MPENNVEKPKVTPKAVRSAKGASDCSALPRGQAAKKRRSKRWTRRLRRWRLALQSQHPLKSLRRQARRTLRAYRKKRAEAAEIRANTWQRPAARRQKRRRRRLVRVAAALMAFALMMWLAYRSAARDGIKVKPSREMPCVDVFFNQDDPAWSEEVMGDTGRTLGKDGDGVACLASLMAMQDIEAPFPGTLNPGTLNAWLSENDCYERDGDLKWSKVASLLGAKLVDKPARWGDEKLLDRLLQQEVYAVVEVRRPDVGKLHRVLLVGSMHGEYTIVDPLDGMDALNSLGIYRNRIYSLKYLTT